MKKSNSAFPELYVGVDLMKLICALLIVYIHTYNHDMGYVGEWVLSTLSPIGVPFFFIVSGFFYAKGLQKSSDPGSYFFRYMKRIGLMYLFWTVLTFPVAWMNLGIAHADYNIIFRLLYVVRCFFFTGSIGIYWYVLALIYNSAIIYYALKWKKQNLLYILAVAFFVVGVLYDGGILRETVVGKFIYVVIGSERNFLNVGLFYMCIGMLFVNKRIVEYKIVLILTFLILVLVATWYNSVSSYRIMQAPLAVTLFLISLQYQYPIISPLSITMRKWSTAIYLAHFPFILTFDYYLKRGTFVDFFVAIMFALFLFYFLSFVCPQRVLKTLYG